MNDILDWFVIWTRYGAEGKICEVLSNYGLQAWFPKEPIVVFDRRLKRMLIKPLGRYLFVRAPSPLSPEIWHVPAQTDGFIGWLGGEIPIPVGAEINRFRSELNDDEIIPEDVALRSRRGWDVGDVVEVVEGVWSGHSGVCEKITENGRSVVVNIKGLLGRALGISLPATWCVLKA